MGIFNLFSSTPKGFTKVNIEDFIHRYMVGAVIPVNVFTQLQDKRLNGEKYAYLKNDVISSIEKAHQSYIEQKEQWRNSVQCNNTGIEQEKDGNIEDAIANYEMNVKAKMVATHPYERLMIIYRKRKEYDKEIAVIKSAIEVFEKENERRSKYAIKEYPSKTKEINEALNTCVKVCTEEKNSFGYPKVCFNPYDVNKYKQRLEKVKILKEKANLKNK